MDLSTSKFHISVYLHKFNILIEFIKMSNQFLKQLIEGNCLKYNNKNNYAQFYVVNYQRNMTKKMCIKDHN